MRRNSITEIINGYGRSRTPFLLIIDFLAKKPVVVPLDSINKTDILFNINGFGNDKSYSRLSETMDFDKYPVSMARFSRSFDTVISNINYGNSYLVNLTFPTLVQTNYTLRHIYFQSTAKYKLLYRNEFVVFSPEIFIQTDFPYIFSHPMKGTIDANVPDAAKKILGNAKEQAEHATIVDLIRNDLSMISGNVTVEKYRYIDKLRTNQKTLLQVSSKISGKLSHDFYRFLGDLLWAILPAGSISGAPKNKTLDIIRQAELCERGYYTGIFGVFDGKNLDCGVMIRFIENNSALAGFLNKTFIHVSLSQKKHTFVFRSGGGITSQSDKKSEYNELIDKVYVPAYRNH